MFVITATAVHHTTDSHGVSTDVTYQIPTFFLHENVQGITSADHAAEIAKSIICPMAKNMELEGVTVHAQAKAWHDEASDLLAELFGERSLVFLTNFLGEKGQKVYDYLRSRQNA